MPLPFILGAAALVAGVTGVGSGIHGASEMKSAKETMDAAEYLNKQNQDKFKKKDKATNKTMDKLGKLELNIMSDFSEFADVIEKIQNRPEFKAFDKKGVKLPKYNKEELREVSIGASVILGGLGGAAAGTAGGFAAAGATTSAVMALGTASTGTAISSLSGAAATNAALAALGGGAKGIGGGMALGSAVLSGATLGVGLLVGGVIFNKTGKKMSNQAEEAFDQVYESSKKVRKICNYLDDLKETAEEYTESLEDTFEKYNECFSIVRETVNNGKLDWWEFTQDEKNATENSSSLVGLLYKMCKVNLVNVSENEEEMNTINKQQVNSVLNDAYEVVNNLK